MTAIPDDALVLAMLHHMRPTASQDSFAQFMAGTLLRTPYLHVDPDEFRRIAAWKLDLTEKGNPMSETVEVKAERPPGEYCIVELMGHTTLVGRYAEVERFGTKMLAIEPLFAGTMLPPIFHGGSSIYRLTPCSAEVAYANQPTQEYQIPPTIRAIVPVTVLPAPETLSDAIAGAMNSGRRRETDWDPDDDLPL